MIHSVIRLKLYRVLSYFLGRLLEIEMNLTKEQVEELIKLLKRERKDLEGCTLNSSGPNADHMLYASIQLIKSLEG